MYFISYFFEFFILFSCCKVLSLFKRFYFYFTFFISPFTIKITRPEDQFDTFVRLSGINQLSNNSKNDVWAKKASRQADRQTDGGTTLLYTEMDKLTEKSRTVCGHQC